MAARARKSKKSSSKSAKAPKQSKKKANAKAERLVINFDYIKNTFFRTVRVDGVHGGVSPRGTINMAVWQTRVPLPKRVTHEVLENGTLGKEIQRDVRPAVIRDVEANLVFDFETARKVHEWLGEKIKIVERQLEERLRGEE